ncbi:expressed unknown protein [Seminavis robusta]|uniref:Uncharacterized protein n=1 Tax=Seminavis robusta TaxID=568900 RepID=A0A9N8DUW3_9STRA|nr:expressed unknown protein [Seminavis robusta]|eukprot:Sro299_g111480.1 n/a (258) ;mRNA; f:63035-63808
MKSFFDFSLCTCILSAALCGAKGEVVYTVFAAAEGGCQVGTNNISTVMDPQAQEIGYCQNHGVGASLYNSIEVLSCTDNCLCFKQWASDDADGNCNESLALGFNVKVSCFDKCLQDCNGNNCGDIALPGSATTRLQLTLTGSSAANLICATPVSEDEFVCETTGMIKDSDGDIVDDFEMKDTDSEAQSHDDSDASDGNPPQEPSGAPQEQSGAATQEPSGAGNMVPTLSTSLSFSVLGIGFGFLLLSSVTSDSCSKF